jgi:hypothetical protein
MHVRFPEVGLENECEIVHDVTTPTTSNGSIPQDSDEVVDPLNVEMHNDGIEPPVLRLPSGRAMCRPDAICLYLAEVSESLLAPYDSLHRYYRFAAYLFNLSMHAFSHSINSFSG